MPPAALFAVLAKKQASGVAGDKAFTVGHYLHAAINLDVGALAETGRATFELLRSLAGHRSEGLNRLALLKIDGKGLLNILHLLLFVSASEYDGGPGDLWAVKGELPSEGLPTLVKLLPIHTARNTTFWGTSWEEFEVHVTALDYVHL